MPQASNETVNIFQRATEVVETLQRLGYGETSEKALPGSYDPFVPAFEAATERLIDQALGKNNS